MRLSEKPTENEIAALNLIVPNNFRIEIKDGQMVLTVYSFGVHGKEKPLFNYIISPGSRQNFSGDLLPSLVTDLATTVRNAWNAIRDSQEGPVEVRIMRIIEGSLEYPVKRWIRQNEFEVSVERIYTLDEGDWFI